MGNDELPRPSVGTLQRVGDAQPRRRHGRMREFLGESHVACGIDIGIARTQVLVHFDTVAADAHVRRVEAEVLDVRLAACA